jgi:hypothetical protein
MADAGSAALQREKLYVSCGASKRCVVASANMHHGQGNNLQASSCIYGSIGTFLCAPWRHHLMLGRRVLGQSVRSGISDCAGKAHES